MEEFIDFLSIPPDEEDRKKEKGNFREIVNNESGTTETVESFHHDVDSAEEMWVKVNRKGEVIDKIDIECLCGRKITIVFDYNSK